MKCIYCAFLVFFTGTTTFNFAQARDKFTKNFTASSRIELNNGDHRIQRDSHFLGVVKGNQLDNLNAGIDNQNGVGDRGSIGYQAQNPTFDFSQDFNRQLDYQNIIENLYDKDVYGFSRPNGTDIIVDDPTPVDVYLNGVGINDAYKDNFDLLSLEGLPVVERQTLDFSGDLKDLRLDSIGVSSVFVRDENSFSVPYGVGHADTFVDINQSFKENIDIALRGGVAFQVEFNKTIEDMVRLHDFFDVGSRDDLNLPKFDVASFVEQEIREFQEDIEIDVDLLFQNDVLRESLVKSPSAFPQAIRLFEPWKSRSKLGQFYLGELSVSNDIRGGAGDSNKRTPEQQSDFLRLMNDNSVPRGMTEYDDDLYYFEYQQSAESVYNIPFAAKNSIIVGFSPEASTEEIAGLAEKFDLEFVDAIPELGMVKYMVSSVGDSDQDLSNLEAKIENLDSQVEIDFASLDYVVSLADRAVSQFTIKRGKPFRINGEAEHKDWGVADTQVDQFWEKLSGKPPVPVYILDTEYQSHIDLNYSVIEGSDSSWGDDHGTLVAGVLCARHDNGFGLQGALPNCKLTALNSEDYVLPASKNESFRLQIHDREGLLYRNIKKISRSVKNESSFTIVNMSLGYNVATVLMASVFEDQKSSINYVKKINAASAKLIDSWSDGIIIFTSAGNDKNVIKAENNNPIAQYAADRKRLGEQSQVIVVEGHDSIGRTQDSSNLGGDLSCPSVNVLTTAGKNDLGELSNDHFVYADGTSLAAPYCAAGYAVFRQLRPNYEHAEVISCLISYGEKDRAGVGAPRMKVGDALRGCPPKI